MARKNKTGGIKMLIKFKGITLEEGSFTRKDYKNHFYLYDKNNNVIYCEYSSRFWIIRKYDKNNNQIYAENSDGYWGKSKYDNNNNRIYYEDSAGFWIKQKYNKNNNMIYYEDSSGEIIDYRRQNED